MTCQAQSCRLTWDALFCTISGMARQISIRLDDDIAERLDEELTEIWREHGGYGPTRSDYIRDALDRALRAAQKKRVDGRKAS